MFKKELLLMKQRKEQGSGDMLRKELKYMLFYSLIFVATWPSTGSQHHPFKDIASTQTFH